MNRLKIENISNDEIFDLIKTISKKCQRIDCDYCCLSKNNGICLLQGLFNELRPKPYFWDLEHIEKIIKE